MSHMTPRALTACALFATLMAVGAMIKIPLPNIPFTLQTLFVFLSGLVLGPKLGLYACVLYMTFGLIGLPVFAGGGGFSYVLRPSFGYILSFCPAAYVVGLLSRRHPNARLLRLVLCCLAGLAIIYSIGIFYYAMILKYYLLQAVSLWQLCLTGALVFLPGDVLGCFLASWLYRRMPPSLLPKP